MNMNMNTAESQSLALNSTTPIKELIFPPNNRVTSTSTLSLPKRAQRIVAALAGVMAATLALFMPSAAQAITNGTGTTKAWVVQTLFLTNKPACSGVAINELMVITAEHCTAASVQYPDGGVSYVASAHPVPGLDAQVLVLTREHPLLEYPTLGPDYVTLQRRVAADTAGSFYGYGSAEWPQKRLDVSVLEHGLAADDSTVDRFYMLASSGWSEPGDSGGPLIINDMLVGVYQGSGVLTGGRNVMVFQGISKALSVIRQLQHAREMRAVKEESYYPGPWISSVDVDKGYLSATLSSQLLNKGTPITIWVNGNYSSTVQGACSACTKTDINGGSIIKPFNTVKDGDLIQIGIGSATGGPQASELLFEKRLNGIEAVTLENGKAVVRVSPTLFNSEQRTVIWLNGAYYSEVYKNRIYYGASYVKAGGGITITVGAATLNTYVQIGIVPGTPGERFGTPGTSKLLYSASLDGKLETATPVDPTSTGFKSKNDVPGASPAKTLPARP